ncbi:MAG: nicotinamide-nucleotide amidohydrolase family protein [Tenericutes bacterium]|nr:nicotinamide-nucleotide amidohydrolase family protein [Mycoplasmatota bacterium]
MRDVVNLLIEKKMTIATMESCTGGFVASSITDIDGSSSVLKFSAVTYSNEYKIKMGVSKEVIDKYSVYSMNVAREMAKKISNFANSDIGVGITGKINRVDENNLFGDNNKIYYAIYDKNSDKYYEYELIAINDTRLNNKKYIMENISKNLLEIYK